MMHIQRALVQGVADKRERKDCPSKGKLLSFLFCTVEKVSNEKFTWKRRITGARIR